MNEKTVRGSISFRKIRRTRSGALSRSRRGWRSGSAHGIRATSPLGDPHHRRLTKPVHRYSRGPSIMKQQSMRPRRSRGKPLLVEARWWMGGNASALGTVKAMRTVSVALAAAAATTTVIQGAPAHADPRWVTFAFSPSTWNLSQVWGSQDQASTEQAAISACRNAGASDCQIVASSGDCVAFVKNGDSWNAATGWSAPLAVFAAAAGLGIPPGTTKTASECSWDPVQPSTRVTWPYADP